MKVNVQLYFRGEQGLTEPFKALFDLHEQTIPYGKSSITFWFGIADIVHEQADFALFQQIVDAPAANVLVYSEDGRKGRAKAVSGQKSGNFFSLALAGCEPLNKP